MYLPPHLDGHSSEYLNWRQTRLAESSVTNPPPTIPLVIDLTPQRKSMPRSQNIDPSALDGMIEQIRIYGFAHYRLSDDVTLQQRRLQLVRLAAALGLRRGDQGVIADDDSLALLEHRSESNLTRFPPYSDKTLNWHTDGYYNATDQEVRAFLLHCLQPATAGGELTLLDPELLLIAVYDHDPTLVEPLIATDAMTLPGNRDQDGHHRPDTTVPVIFAHSDQTLGMRFTTRGRNIRWKNEQTKAASIKVSEIIDSLTLHHVRLRLNTNEGIVSRNILHHRSCYSDLPSANRRQMLRGRYLDTPAPSTHEHSR